MDDEEDGLAAPKAMLMWEIDVAGLASLARRPLV